MPAWNPQANDIFLEALEIAAPANQQDFIKRACGDDAELREQVNSLIAASQKAGNFLETPPQAAANLLATELQPITETPGTQIGPYKLLQQIGEGGMGVVYMAEQSEPVKRRVALKIIKPGMDTRQVIARFEAERQALSLMDHPNIAKVLDAGTTATGRPYFVMELVKGQPITQYCDEKHLTPRERLELLLPVCHAIQHAHQKGIIHRDIKPSNILVAEYDQRPVPKVIDFGVAKATSQALTEKTMFTGFGQIVGTLEYMSPEQAKVNQLDIDTRSDIYSLGVLLYELITGSTPFDKRRLRSAAWDEMLRIIREEEPPKPSTRLSDSCEALASISANRHIEPAKLTKLVRGELDWIVMKALEKDRSRRYETANAFAADLHAYLNDEQVVACPPSAGYSLRKFARRNKVRLAAASVLAVALLTAVSGIGWAVRDRAARQAEAEQERTEWVARVTTQVETIFGDVDRLIQERRWNDALAAAARAEAAIVNGEIPETMRSQVAGRVNALKFVVRLERIRKERMRCVGDELDNATAIQEYHQAFRDHGIDPLRNPSDDAIKATILDRGVAIPVGAALDDWVTAVHGHTEQYGPECQPLIALCRRIDPDPLRERVRAMRGLDKDTINHNELRKMAETIEFDKHHPATIHLLADQLERCGLKAEWKGFLSKAQLHHPTDVWINTLLAAHVFQESGQDAMGYARAAVCVDASNAMNWNNLGIRLRDKQPDQAVLCYRKALELHSPDEYRAGQQHKFRSALYTNLGSSLKTLGRLAEAEASHRKAIELDAMNGVAFSNLGVTLRKMGKIDEAIAAHRKAVQLSPRNAENHRSLGATLVEAKRLDEAVVAFRDARSLAPQNAGICANLAEALDGLNRNDEAIAEYRTAIQLDPLKAVYHYNLGVLLGKKKQWAEALRCHEAAAVSEPKAAVIQRSIGAILRRLQRHDEAITTLRKAIELDARNAMGHCLLGDAQLAAGRSEDAVASFQKAVELDPASARHHFELGVAFSRMQQNKESLACFQHALKLEPNNANTHRNLALIYARLDQPAEREACLRQAIKLDANFAAAYNDLAWALVTRQDHRQEDYPEALKLATCAIELAPQEASFWGTLGVARYRAGEFASAVTALEKCLEQRIGDDDPRHWFFLAMARWQLGEKEKARQWFDKSMAWMEKNQLHENELRRFRAEAEKLLGAPPESEVTTNPWH